MAIVVRDIGGYYDKEVRPIRDLSFVDGGQIYLEVEVRGVWCRNCGKAKVKRLDWLSNNPFYTKRVAFYVGSDLSGDDSTEYGERAQVGLTDGEGFGKVVHGSIASVRS